MAVRDTSSHRLEAATRGAQVMADEVKLRAREDAIRIKEARGDPKSLGIILLYLDKGLHLIKTIL